MSTLPFKNKIWICGAGGMLGQELREQFGDCLATDRDLDITCPEAVESWIFRKRPTHIINCAAYTAVDRAESEWLEAYRVNADGPRNLAKAAKRYGCRLIQLSTDFVFDGAKRAPYLEDDSCNPLNVYGKSKYEGERAVQEEGGEYCIVRTSWLVGRGGSHFIAKIREKAFQGEILRVVNDQFGRVTFCHDLARAIAADLLDYQGVIHFANQGVVSWYQLARELLAELKVKVPIDPIRSDEYPASAKRPAYSALDTSLYESRFSPIRDYRLALKEYLNEAVATV